MTNHSIDKNEKTIDSLYDDCLIYIFEYLDVKDKLVLEMVSKRWNQVAKRSWSQVKTLDVHPDFLYPESQIQEEHKIANTKFLTSILDRCSKYLQKISIRSCGLDTKNPKLQTNLRNCNQLTTLFIDNTYLTDEFLMPFFENLMNLRTLALKNLRLNGYCFISLKKNNNIKELSVENCEFESDIDIRTFIISLKNLNILKLYTSDNNIANAINLSEIENLTDVSIIAHWGIPGVELLGFLFRQKKLSKLLLGNMFVGDTFMNKLPIECLKSLNFQLRGRKPDRLLINSLNRFENLENLILNLSEHDFNDNYLRIITESVSPNIKNIEINFFEFTLMRKKSIVSFGRLVNLESFTLNKTVAHITSCDKDFIIQNLTQCQNMKNLFLKNINLTNKGFQSISKFSNLINLQITASEDETRTYDISDEEMSEIIRKLVNLKELVLYGFVNLTDKFIETASEIKFNRQDSHVLKISLKNTKIRPSTLKKGLKLISLVVLE